MSQHHLWPPLEVVEAALDGHQATALGAVGGRFQSELQNQSLSTSSAQAQSHARHLLLPITELIERRAAVLAQHFSATWASGRLVQITFKGSVIGVLLNRLVKGRQWLGWVAASETSWAGAFDVLLEPEDDPFEPLFGVIQTWNPVTIEHSDNIQVQIVGEISALRLAAIRAVAQECADGLAMTIPVEPGRIALRMAGEKFMVLTGTPLGQDDPRREYQNAYNAVAARLIEKQLTHRASSAQPSRSNDGDFGNPTGNS